MYDDSQKKILVVEDDAVFRHSLTDGLSEKYSVSEAEDGEQAMEKTLVHKPDLIILDLLLPKVDGFEFLRRLRKYPDAKISKTVVIILSNLSSNKDILSTLALKVQGYFVKANTKMDDIYENINKLLADLPQVEQEKV